MKENMFLLRKYISYFKLKKMFFLRLQGNFLCLFYGLPIDFLKKPSAARHAKFELRIFKKVRIEERIVIRKVSIEIEIIAII